MFMVLSPPLFADDIDDQEEVFDHKSYMVQPWIVHKVVSKLSLGATLDVKRSDISDTEDDGLLEQGDITGSDGGARSGIGPALIWDSRDSLFFPTKGSWHKIWSCEWILG
jgi:outer membrane protein assembly factor BamA